MEPIVELRGLSKTFGAGAEQVAALQQVSLAVEPGEIFGIIGLSGAGKSTLVRCINLLERPDAGKVLFHGEDLMAMPTRRLRQVRRKISMIFQSFNLLEQRTALDNICFPLELEGVPRAKARALASNPEVLLCDEATSALDPQTTNSILNLLQTISRERKITVILITHQMSVIEQICNRVAILDSGVVAEIGEVERVFSNPQSAAGRRLVSPDVALPLSTWVGPVARIAFNGNTSEEPIIAEVAMEKGIKLSILGADTRNVDGKAFGTMLVSLPEDAEKKQEVLAYLNHFDGVTAEVIQ